MKYVKIERPYTAYQFYTADGGTNAEKLTEDVKADGGTVEINGEVATIRVDGKVITLPLGFTAIIDGNTFRVLSNKDFDEDYIPVEDMADFELSSQIDVLHDRISQLELRVEQVGNLGGRVTALETVAKKSSKAEAAKTSDQ